MGMSRCGFLRFLRRGRDRVESDVGEEDDARAAQNAAPSEVAEMSGVRRDEGMPVRGGNVWMGNKNRVAMTTKARTVPTLMNTMNELKLADSRTPMTRIVVISAITR